MKEIGLGKDRCFCSKAVVAGDRVMKVEAVLDKAAVLQQLAKPVVAVGDGSNDAEMIKLAEIGIGFGGFGQSPRLFWKTRLMQCMMRPPCACCWRVYCKKRILHAQRYTAWGYQVIRAIDKGEGNMDKRVTKDELEGRLQGFVP